MADAKLRAVITAEDRASGTIRNVTNSVEGMGERITTALKRAAVVGATALATGLGAVSKMAFDQVRQVENATFALRAYEKDAGKVSEILRDLVAFARSDMGVLFQREELFKAASNLRGFGVASDQVVSKVKLLSRGVALGMTTFDELSQILGRVVQRGRLDAEVFDMLAQRGIILDSSMRGAAVSSDKLWKSLEKVLPAELLSGRAKTIDGAFIRLKSSLRDLGSSFLGVDKETSRFIEGKLGDQFVKGVQRLRDVLADPAIKEGLASMAAGILETTRSIAEFLGPKIAELIPKLQELWREVLQPLGAMFGTALVAAIGLFIDALNKVIPWISDNRGLVLGLVAAYASLKTIMFLEGVAAAFGAVMASVRAQAMLTAGAGGIGGVSKSVTTMQALLASPLIVKVSIAAGMIALGIMYNRLLEVAGLIQSLDQGREASIRKARDKIVNAKNKKERQQGQRELYMAQQQPTFGRQIGGSVESGRPYMVGESGPEVFIPSQSGQVKPTPQAAGASIVNLHVNVGVFAGTLIERRKLAEVIMSDIKDVARSRNMKVDQLLGGAAGK